MINFISNLPQDLRSGGFSAMNVAALEAVKKCGHVHYVGPINPGVSTYRKVISKALRTFGRPGEFFFFSQDRLLSIQQEVHSKCSPSASLDFYHGFTPWVLTSSPRPYITWSDCTFHDYLRIYHDPADFKADDISRIEEAEARWLGKAERVLFTSHWGAASACQTYGLSESKVAVVGLFGEVDPPDLDAYQGSYSFLFVSTNFQAKGGRVVLEAFRQLRVTHLEATLTIIGDGPSNCQESGVILMGFLRKEVPVEAARFRQLFAQARGVVHPTRSDILPLMLVEAGYFGMPVISSRRFAIPELVEDGVNGLLVDDPSDVAQISKAMENLLNNEVYLPMRTAAWEKARSGYSRQQFESCLADQIKSVITSLS
ncbi:MAG: glycosyltransferase [Verrucomicrobia bacterium]|nr:glycosyltransferase [Verrucomicrobiota bacterium]